MNKVTEIQIVTETSLKDNHPKVSDKWEQEPKTDKKTPSSVHQNQNKSYLYSFICSICLATVNIIVGEMSKIYGLKA